jgi:S1-C subfamily serine protease
MCSSAVSLMLCVRRKHMQSTWQQLSKEISESVARVGRAVVAVDGGSGHTASGILWRSDLVLTAAHTIRQNADIHIIPRSGYSVRAQLAGRGPGADVALLRASQEIGGDYAEFGDTTSLAVGEMVVAIGRTRRGNLVASSGILSGLMGEWQFGRTRIDQFIRPDLTLYSGFSGGALVGANGKILGMTTSGVARGRPITIPSSTLTRIAEELSEKGHLKTPYIGVVMQPVPIPESLQKTSGVTAATGLLAMHVEASGPADNAGILLGDVLVQLDEEPFDDLSDLQGIPRRSGVSQEVKAILIRGGQKVELTVKIGERPLR